MSIFVSLWPNKYLNISGLEGLSLHGIVLYTLKQVILTLTMKKLYLFVKFIHNTHFYAK